MSSGGKGKKKSGGSNNKGNSKPKETANGDKQGSSKDKPAEPKEAQPAEKKAPSPKADQESTEKQATDKAPADGEKKKSKKNKDKDASKDGKKEFKDLKPEELPNRAPVVDPYGEPLTKEQERQRVEIKTSGIPKGGNGVWSLFDFAKDDVICEFLGKRCKREEAYNQMQYAIEFTNDDGETVLIDGWGYDNAAAIANDALGRTRLPFARNNARFWHYGNRMFLCAKRNIRKAEEIFVQYGHEYWQMTKEDYHKVNKTDQIIELKLDTCH